MKANAALEAPLAVSGKKKHGRRCLAVVALSLLSAPDESTPSFTELSCKKKGAVNVVRQTCG